jgi:hypothetical protein
MNRIAAASSFAWTRLAIVGALAMGSVACASSGVGDPCTPEAELGSTPFTFSGDLRIDVNSVQCETRVCLAHFFVGRVTCPFGNSANGRSGGKCQQAQSGGSDLFGLYTVDGTATGDLCCPVIGDLNSSQIELPVKPQCIGTSVSTSRAAEDAVYCTCRCDVFHYPDGTTSEDPSSAHLCSCPDGFSCQLLVDPTKGAGNKFPTGAWGSFCVKKSDTGFSQADTSADGQGDPSVVDPGKLATACGQTCSAAGTSLNCPPQR